MLDPIDAILDSLERLRKRLRKGQNRQVRNQDERDQAKATALSWFRSRKPRLRHLQNSSSFSKVDAGFATLLKYSDHNTTRTKYLDVLKELKTHLVTLREDGLTANHEPRPEKPVFANLVSDKRMLSILDRRWDETLICVDGGAHLAATVMMGGLLEALLLARVNALQDCSVVFKAKGAPKDKAGNPKKLHEWGLRNFLDVHTSLVGSGNLQKT